MSEPQGERLSLWFEAPGRVGVRRSPLPEPGPGEARVRASVSAISTGTERAAFRGRLDPGWARDETLGALREGGFRYPFQYGYASVGVVDRVGPPPAAGSPPGARLRAGERVFGFVPHQSVFCAPAPELLRVPRGLPDERAALFPYLETAVNLLLDGAPRVGDRVAVVGQGVLGLSLTALLARFPLGGLVTVEPRGERRELSRAFGAPASVPPEGAEEAVRSELGGGAERVFEVSGHRAGLDLAIRLAAREGRVVAGSWLAGGTTELDLGGWFHRGRVGIVSSQVSRLPPLGPSWTVGRRRELAWSLLAGIPLESLVTDRFPLAEAERAYARLDGGEALAVLLTGGGWESGPVPGSGEAGAAAASGPAVASGSAGATAASVSPASQR